MHGKHMLTLTRERLFSREYMGGKLWLPFIQSCYSLVYSQLLSSYNRCQLLIREQFGVVLSLAAVLVVQQTWRHETK